MTAGRSTRYGNRIVRPPRVPRVQGADRASGRKGADRLSRLKGANVLSGLTRSVRGLERRDDGNAIVEYLILGVLFLIPLVYVFLAVFAVQSTAYGVTAAAREAARAFVTAPTTTDGLTRACAAAAIALRNESADTFDCSTQLAVQCVIRDACAVSLEPGLMIRVIVRARAELPFLPGSLFGHPLGVDVSAQHDEVVDSFRAAG